MAKCKCMPVSWKMPFTFYRSKRTMGIDWPYAGQWFGNRQNPSGRFHLHRFPSMQCVRQFECPSTNSHSLVRFDSCIRPHVTSFWFTSLRLHGQIMCSCINRIQRKPMYGVQLTLNRRRVWPGVSWFKYCLQSLAFGGLRPRDRNAWCLGKILVIETIKIFYKRSTLVLTWE